MALLPSPPPPASITTPGLMALGIQAFLGQKTIQTNTAASGERALTVGTSVADGSVNEGFSLFSARTGIGGTEVEWLKVRRPTSYGVHVATIDGNNVTNTGQLELANGGAGFSGLTVRQWGGGYLNLSAQQSNSPTRFYAENKGLQIEQNSNAYDNSTLMRFIVNVPTQLATTIPAFDFQSGVLGSGQKLARWQANGAEVAAITSAGLTLNGYANSLISCSGSWIDVGSGLPVRTASYFASSAPVGSTAYYASGNAGFSGAATFNAWGETADAAGEIACRLGTYVADGSANAATKLLSLATNMGGTPVEKLFVIKDGTIENTTAGAGIVLRSPDGTRWRFTISNAGAAVIALA